MSFWQKAPYKEAIKGVTDPVFTPNIDRLADEGLVLTQAVSTCPLCSPYRGMLFSGRFPEQNGVRSNCNSMRTDSLKEDITCMTDVYADSGYSVGYVGKWHLDMPVTNCDESLDYAGDGAGYYPDGSKVGDVDLSNPANLYKSCWDAATPASRRHSIDFWLNHATREGHGLQTTFYRNNEGKRFKVDKWSAEADTDAALSYIHNKNGERDKDKPFFLVVSYNPPHSPYTEISHTDPEMFHQYYSEEKVPDVMDLLNRPNVPVDARAKDFVRYYFSSVSGVDKQIGRLLEAVDQGGEIDNTIVIFTADHGDMMGSHDMGAKNNPYEESFRIPYIIRYPEVLKNRLEDLHFGGPDVMPTLLGLSGLSNAIPSDLDGVDYSDVLINGSQSTVEKPKSALYIYDYPEKQQKGVRTDQYTFVLERDESGQMAKSVIFDHVNDPYQLNNMDYDDLPEDTLQFLLEELGYWLKKANDKWYQDKVFSDFIPYP